MEKDADKSRLSDAPEAAHDLQAENDRLRARLSAFEKKTAGTGAE